MGGGEGRWGRKVGKEGACNWEECGLSKTAVRGGDGAYCLPDSPHLC